MDIRVLFLSAVTCLVVGQPPSCRNDPTIRVVGGEDGCARMFPSHVILGDTGDEIFCGGTLIGPKTVLTAAHCVARNEEEIRLPGRLESIKCPIQNITYSECTSFSRCPLGKIVVEQLRTLISMLNVVQCSTPPWSILSVILSKFCFGAKAEISLRI